MSRVGATSMHDESGCPLTPEQERLARLDAERLLAERTRELEEARRGLTRARHFLQVALSKSGELLWQWERTHQRFEPLLPDAADLDAFLWGPVDRLMGRVHPEDRGGLSTVWDACINGQDPEFERTFRLMDEGEWRWLRLYGRAFESDSAGQVTQVAGALHDVTSLKSAEYSSKLMAATFANSREAMLILSHDSHIIHDNEAFRRLLRTVGVGEKPDRLDDIMALPGLSAERRQGTSSRFESLIEGLTGKALPIEVTLTDFVADESDSPLIIATLRDVSDARRAREALEKLAKFDSLTGLRNRFGFEQYMRDRLEADPTRQVAFLFIDVDGFKTINDSLGHETGDRVLMEMAGLIDQSLPPGSTLARWGGDEFVAAVDMPTEAPDAWEGVAQGLVKAMHRQYDVNGCQILLSASVGVSLYPRHGDNVDFLLRDADVAMFEAKSAGKNRFRLYHDGLTDDAMRRVTLLSELKGAIEQGGLGFVIQPKFDAAGNVCGGELLVRWRSLLHGVVPPSVFVPLAEKNGLASALGKRVIEYAAEYLALIRQSGRDLRLAVNVSASQLLDSDFVAYLLETCERFGVTPSNIELEVTESIFLQDNQDPDSKLVALRQAGFRIAIDDFGTGYSSLGYLRRFDFDVVKIDRSFVNDLENDPKACKIVEAIIDLCRALSAETVAEGVETQVQHDLLRGMGVDRYQGFLLSRPMPVDDFSKLLL